MRNRRSASLTPIGVPLPSTIWCSVWGLPSSKDSSVLWPCHWGPILSEAADLMGWEVGAAGGAGERKRALLCVKGEGWVWPPGNGVRLPVSKRWTCVTFVALFIFTCCSTSPPVWSWNPETGPLSPTSCVIWGSASTEFQRSYHHRGMLIVLKVLILYEALRCLEHSTHSKWYKQLLLFFALYKHQLGLFLIVPISSSRSSQVALVVNSLPASAGDVRDVGSIPGSGSSRGGEQGNPLQYSCLEIPMHRGAWPSTVLRVTKSLIKQTT